MYPALQQARPAVLYPHRVHLVSHRRVRLHLPALFLVHDAVLIEHVDALAQDAIEVFPSKEVDSIVPESRAPRLGTVAPAQRVRQVLDLLRRALLARAHPRRRREVRADRRADRRRRGRVTSRVASRRDGVRSTSSRTRSSGSRTRASTPRAARTRARSRRGRAGTRDGDDGDDDARVALARACAARDAARGTRERATRTRS